MRITKKTLKEVEETKNILCNRCGQTCAKYFDDTHNGGFYGLIEAKFSTGYLSEVFDDMLVYSFSLCEECLVVLFEEFKIAPKQEDLNIPQVVLGKIDKELLAKFAVD